MRAFVPFITLFCTSLATASAVTLASRTTLPVERGLLGTPEIDICANVDADLEIAFGRQLNVYGHIDVCICVSALPVFIESNIIAKTAAVTHGNDVVKNAILGMINGCHDKDTCHYPPHSEPVCKPGKPCGFKCTDGYELGWAYGRETCLCPSGHSECNGKCVPHKNCPSKAPASTKNEYFIKHAIETCAAQHKTACGIAGRGGKAFECINTFSDLESCGGCATPLFPGQLSGEDCSSIPGASGVSCQWGQCEVSSCKHGYQLHNNSCVRARRSVVSRVVPNLLVDESKREDAAAWRRNATFAA